MIVFYKILFKFITKIKDADLAAKLIGFVFYYFIPIRKKKVLENLQVAFPQKKEDELKKIRKKVYRSISKTLVELINFQNADKSKILTMIDTSEIIEQINHEGAIILLTAHIGNWELGALAVGILSNKDFYVLAKEQKSSFVSKMVTDIREKFGNKEIYLGNSVKRIFSALRSNNIVGIVGDQRGPKESIKVKFFNRDTTVYTGAAQFAIKTKSKIVVTFVIRKENNQYKFFCRTIDPMLYKGSFEENTAKITQAYFAMLEEYIRKYPEQWFWFHNIWKY